MYHIKHFSLLPVLLTSLTLSVHVSNGNQIRDLPSTYTLLWQSVPGLVIALAKNPKNNLLAVNHYGSSDVIILDAATGIYSQILQSPDGPDDGGLKDLEWSPNGVQIGVAFYDKVDIWSFSNGIATPATTAHSYGDTHQIDWSPNNPELFTAVWGNEAVIRKAGFSDERKLLVLNSINGMFETLIPMPGLTKLRWSPDGKAIAALMEYAEHDPKTELIPPPEIRLLDPVTYQLVSKISFDMDPYMEFSWLRDSSGLIGIECNVSIDGCKIWQWDYNHPGKAREFPVGVMAPGLRDGRFNLNPSGDLLALTDVSKPYLYIINVKTGDLLFTINGLVNPVDALAWIDDRELVTASDRLRAFRLN